MVKRRTPWKEGKVLSIETRKGVFVLAQMLKEPFMRFYNVFRENENWGKVDTGIFKTLFVNAVTGSFLKSSNVSAIEGAIPDFGRENSNIWINGKSGSRKVKVWDGTEDEKEFIILGAEPGGSLVEKDLMWAPTPKNPTRAHPSGVIDGVILEDIPLDDEDLINEHELTGLAVFPLMNERLYLCYKENKNVDPYKDLVFNREISKDYKIAIEIISGGGDKGSRENILETYYR